MSKPDFLLTFCIPTFNRSKVLRETLESITSQAAFSQTDDVEIVVSDNASTDDTSEVVAEYVSRFPGKVVLYRQEHNIASANFHTVLKLGRGRYLKLHNDNLIVREDALKPLVDVIRDIAQKAGSVRPVLFMTNGNRVKDNSTALFETCANLDEFLQSVSFFCTWIGGFGLWREDIELSSVFTCDDSMLSQVDVVCRLLAEGRPGIAFYGNYFISKQDHRAGYNWTRVFGKNYLEILKSYVVSGALSQPVYEQAKKEILLRHILPNYFKTTNVYDKTAFFENLADYRSDAYFYEAIAKHVPLLWRFNNPHNHTELRSVGDLTMLPHIHVGNKSRGGINVVGRCDETTRLQIGRFVHLEEDVGFVLGEASPRGSTLCNFWPGPTPQTDGSISVGDDVWIGRGALLMSGAVVGQGAIVESGSRVFGHVPAYSRVAGNPAQVLAYRFEPEVIDKLKSFDFASLSDQAIVNLGVWLHASIDKHNIDVFLEHLAAAHETPAPGLPPPASERVPAVLILDETADAARVEASLAALAAGPHSAYPVIVLTTQGGDVPEWSDELRYLQAGATEYAEVLEQLRTLPDFDWVEVRQAGK